jgi:hypothetical protein
MRHYKDSIYCHNVSQVIPTRYVRKIDILHRIGRHCASARRRVRAAEQSPMDLTAIGTPSLVIDLDRVASNVAELASLARWASVRLRPHTKTHKMPDVARLQVGAGATGLTCAKLGEAEVMASAGLHDILVASPIYGALRPPVVFVNQGVARDLRRPARARRRGVVTRHSTSPQEPSPPAPRSRAGIRSLLTSSQPSLFQCPRTRHRASLLDTRYSSVLVSASRVHLGASIKGPRSGPP